MEKSNSEKYLFGLFIIVISLFIASLITIDISLSAKLIICFFVALLIFIITNRLVIIKEMESSASNDTQSKPKKKPMFSALKFSDSAKEMATEDNNDTV